MSGTRWESRIRATCPALFRPKESAKLRTVHVCARDDAVVRVSVKTPLRNNKLNRYSRPPRVEFDSEHNTRALTGADNVCVTEPLNIDDGFTCGSLRGYRIVYAVVLSIVRAMSANKTLRRSSVTRNIADSPAIYRHRRAGRG